MQIFKFCPHCNKKLFLVYDMELASLFGKDEYEHIKDEKKKIKDSYGNERWPTDYVGAEKAIRQEGGYETTYPDGYPERHMEADWMAFDDFMKALAVSHGPRLHVSYGEQDIIKLRKLSSDGGLTPHKDLQELLTNWMEPKEKERFWKTETEQQKAKAEKIKKEKAEALFNDKNDWKAEIDPNIDDRIKREWCHEEIGFKDAKIWMNTVGLSVGEAKLASWLKAPPRNLTPEQVVQSANLETLRKQWRTETKRDPDANKPPEKPSNLPSTDTIRGWKFRHGISQDEWLKALLVPELAAIVGDRNFLFTKEEAKRRIAEARVRTNPEEIDIELRHNSPPRYPEYKDVDGKRYLVIYTQPFRYKQKLTINEIYCEGEGKGDGTNKAKWDNDIKWFREKVKDKGVILTLTARIIKNETEGEGPTAWKNGTALIIEPSWTVRLKTIAGKRTDWEVMLGEVNKFFETVEFNSDDGSIKKETAKSPADIKKFLDETVSNWENPMAGILLDGTDPTLLINTFRFNMDNTAKATLANAKGVARVYREYEPLPSSPDGNCFFNAFSVLLYGNESLSARLRLAVCLGVMDGTLSGFNAFMGGAMPTVDYDEVSRKLPGMSSSSSYKGWAELQDIAYVSQLLKRPIQLLYYQDPKTSGFQPDRNAYKELEATGGFAFSKFVSMARDSISLEYTYPEYFTIFHVSGNHFVPLVHPNKVIKYDDKDRDIHPYILINFFVKGDGIVYNPKTDLAEAELVVSVIQKNLGDDGDILPDKDEPGKGDWEGKGLGTIIIQGTEPTLQAEQAKLDTGKNYGWSIGGKMNVNRDDFGTGRLTFSPGSYLEMNRDKTRPDTSTSKNPTFRFYLTKYKKHGSGESKGNIEIDIDLNRLEEQHLINTSLDYSQINRGIWVFEANNAGWPEAVSLVNVWYEVQGEFSISNGWLVVRWTDNHKGWTQITEPPNKLNWGSHGGLFKDFDEEITKKWKNIGVKTEDSADVMLRSMTVEEARKWLVIGIGYNEYDLVKYIIEEQKLFGTNPFNNLNTLDLVNLRNEYNNRPFIINFTQLSDSTWDKYLTSAGSNPALKVYTDNTLGSEIESSKLNNMVFLKVRGGLGYGDKTKADPTGFIFDKKYFKGIKCIEIGGEHGPRELDWTYDWDTSINYFDSRPQAGSTKRKLFNHTLELSVEKGGKAQWVRWIDPRNLSAPTPVIESDALILITGNFEVLLKMFIGAGLD